MAMNTTWVSFNTKRIIELLSLLVLLMLCPHICWGDEYVLVMSNNNDLCLHMLKIYNADLRNYGQIKYDEHSVYNKILWEKKTFFVPERTHREGWEGTMYVSRIDINNDNNVELVVKTDRDIVDGMDTEVIYVLEDKYKKYFEDDLVNAHKIGMAMDKISALGGYQLKKLPPGQIEAPKLGRKRTNVEAYKGYYRLYRSILHFLVYDHQIYISMEDRTPKKINNTQWMVIMRYVSTGNTQDVCYYLRIPSGIDKGE
jgi:hypothetical protein